MIKFLEDTIDSLRTSAISGLTQHHLNKRYENDFTIDLAQANYYSSKDFLELIFFADSTFGATDYIASQDLPEAGNGQYTLVLRFYDVTPYLTDLENKKTLAFDLKRVFHNCDVKFYSDDPSFFFQGSWEGLAKHNMSIYKFTGPNGKGIWDAKHAASGGLKNNQIHLTKHLSQLVYEIDNYALEASKVLNIL